MMKYLEDLPLPAQLLAAVAAGGLSLGVLVGLFAGSSSATQGAVSLGEPWTLAEPPIESLMATLQASAQWQRGEVPPEPEIVEPEPEPEPETPGRPGVFKHLVLVAIQREPSLVALLKPVKMPEEQRALMVSLANESGLIVVEPDSVVADGWVVSGISDTYLQITGADSGEIVEYRLFQW